MTMLEKLEIPRRVCPIIFMIDNSGSMTGAPMGAVNAEMESILPELVSLNDDNPDVEIKSKNNSWFKCAARVAIGYGDSNDAVLKEYTGNTETVLHTNDPKDLQKMIRFVSITSSMVASKGGNGDVADSNTDDTDEEL